MAKKTSYLTELIERNERWRAEGGDKAEEHEQDPNFDLLVFTSVQDLPIRLAILLGKEIVTPKICGISVLCGMLAVKQLLDAPITSPVSNHRMNV
jgi:hypothetical protein